MSMELSDSALSLDCDFFYIFISISRGITMLIKAIVMILLDTSEGSISITLGAWFEDNNRL